MIKLIITIISLSTVLFSQSFQRKNFEEILKDYKLKNYLFCENKMLVPDLARRVGIEKAIYKATFDIKDYKPKNIIISRLDSNSIFEYGFTEVTKKNIYSLNFIKDTSNYSIIFNYLFSSAISNDYVELSHPDNLKIYSKKCESITADPSYRINVNNELKQISLYTNILTEKIVNDSTYFLIEKIYTSDADSSIILENTNHYFSDQVLKEAREYTKEYFLSLLPEEYKNFIPEKYIIKFTIETIPKSCNCN